MRLSPFYGRPEVALLEPTINETIEYFVDFVNSRERGPGPGRLSEARSEIGSQRMRVVAIKLVSWLKGMRRLGKPLPLPLNTQFEWCHDLLQLINDKGLLRDVINVREDGLVLSPDLSSQEREELLAFVDAGYKPKLFYTPRRPGSTHNAGGQD
jgi:hypothetical protein